MQRNQRHLGNGAGGVSGGGTSEPNAQTTSTAAGKHAGTPRAGQAQHRSSEEDEDVGDDLGGGRGGGGTEPGLRSRSDTLVDENHQKDTADTEEDDDSLEIIDGGAGGGGRGSEGITEEMRRRTAHRSNSTQSIDVLDGANSARAKAKVSRSNTLSSAGQSSQRSKDDEDTINVIVRVRPQSNQDVQRNDKLTTSFPGEGALWIDNNICTKSFTFNVTFEPEASQHDVFEHSGVKKLINMAINGYSCTAFAFGQTGSGKTHTITGPPDLFPGRHWRNPEYSGLIPRSFYYIFHLIEQSQKNSATSNVQITASYLEIYNEQVKDLLDPHRRKNLAVRWSKNRGFYVENLFVVNCETREDLIAVLEEGLRNRQTGSNSQNEHSSRSHSMLCIHIDSEILDTQDGSSPTEKSKVYITQHGKLTFVDLAGSEKTKTEAGSGSSGIQQTESHNINKSLLVLGNCISALGDTKKRQGYIPFRDSKLTQLLSDSLAGTGVTLMIACISPSAINVTESLNTLRYANRAKKIKSKPVIKMDPREKLILNLKKEMKILRQENHYLRQQLEFPVKPRGQLAKENDQRFLQMLKSTGGSSNALVGALASASGQSASGTSAANGRQISDHGLYEMLHEYMIENDTLRNENMELHQGRDMGRQELQMLARDNEKLLRKLENATSLDRSVLHTPMSGYSSISGSTSISGSMSISSPQNNAFYASSDPSLPTSWNSLKSLGSGTFGSAGSNVSAGQKPPPHQRRPMRPPHRLSEPLINQSPTNGLNNNNNNNQSNLKNSKSYTENLQNSSSGYNAKYQQQKSQEKGPLQRRGSKDQIYPMEHMSINRSQIEYEEELISSELEDNERLRRELLDLETKIKIQSKVKQPLSSR